jgi:hypothetical protein
VPAVNLVRSTRFCQNSLGQLPRPAPINRNRACHEPKANIPVLVHSAKQRVLYRSIKQNHKSAKKLLSYHPDIQHFRVKTFLCRPNSLFFLLPAQKTKQNKIETHGV